MSVPTNFFVKRKDLRTGFFLCKLLTTSFDREKILTRVNVAFVGFMWQWGFKMHQLAGLKDIWCRKCCKITFLK